MSLDEEVDQVWAHEPLDLTLHVDKVGVRQRLVLHDRHVLHDVLDVLVVGETRELVGDHLLSVTGKHLRGVTGSDTGVAGLVALDKEVGVG